MNFSQAFDWFEDGMEWRGVRTKNHSFAKWLNGTVELFDLNNDPLELDNLADKPECADLRKTMEATLTRLLDKRGDALTACTDSINWLDYQRRVVRNAYGPLGDPEGVPDWSLLH